jgi:ribonuclease HI
MIYADGGSRGNPGPAGVGYVIYSPVLEKVASRGVFLGNRAYTNNYAEYQSLIHALKHAKELNLSSIYIRMDSKLIVSQVNAQYKVTNEMMQKLHK